MARALTVSNFPRGRGVQAPARRLLFAAPALLTGCGRFSCPQLVLTAAALRAAEPIEDDMCLELTWGISGYGKAPSTVSVGFRMASPPPALPSSPHLALRPAVQATQSRPTTRSAAPALGRGGTVIAAVHLAALHFGRLSSGR